MLNIDELRKEPHLSASSIDKYVGCSLQYKFSKVDNLPPEFLSDNLQFGKSIHKALADFNQERLNGTRITLEELQKLFDKSWHEKAYGNKQIKYSKGKDFQILSDLGKNMLAAFYQELPDKEYHILSIEEPFRFELEGMDIPIIGVMDLVEEDEEGSIIISDYKTASKAYTLGDVNNNFQLTVYQMAARRNGYANREIVLKLDSLIKTKVPKFKPYYTNRDENDEVRCIRKILDVWDAIQKQIFIPITSWKCNNCEYKTYCDKQQ